MRYALLATFRRNAKLYHRDALSNDAIEHIPNAFTIVERHENLPLVSAFIERAFGQEAERNTMGPPEALDRR